MNSDPIAPLAAALHHACLIQLLPTSHPEILFRHNKDTNRTERVETGRMKEQRPSTHQCEVSLFSQTWGSTALGFGGIGGQAITQAYTIVVEGPCRDAAVYFNGQLAYHIKRPNRKFYEDIAAQQMRHRSGASARYESPETAGGV